MSDFDPRQTEPPTQSRGGLSVNQKLKKLFFGSYTHNIDSKGRVIIPIAYREALGENFVISVTHNFDAIAIYTEEVFYDIFTKMQKYDDRQKKISDYNRRFFSCSFIDQQCDSQGRALIPMKLRNKILKDAKDVTFVSTGKYIIMQPTLDFDKDFDDFMNDPDKDYEEYLSLVHEEDAR